MYILEIIDSSTLDAGIKSKLRNLAEQLLAALNENDGATKEFRKAKAEINERQYAQRLRDSTPGARRDELVTLQLAWRNLLANSVYRMQGARRLMQQLGKILHGQIVRLDTNDSSAKAVAVALKSLIGQCLIAGADVPNAVVRELTMVADISKEKIEDAVREIFQQKKSGSGLQARVNFSSQPIMVTDKDSDEQRALWDAAQVAIKCFYSIRASFGVYSSAKSRLNLPQFVERLEKAKAESDATKFEQINREQRAAEADLFVAASRALSLMLGYNHQIATLEATIKAAADAIENTRGNKNLVAASNCISACGWLHEMKMQLDNCLKNYDPRAALDRLDFDADTYLAAKF